MSHERVQFQLDKDGLRAILAEVVRRFGTPTYAFDVRSLRAQVDRLRGLLPSKVELFYSLKANASLGICNVLNECGIGADVASSGELAIANTAGFAPERTFVAGPYKHPETVSALRAAPTTIVSADSLDELQYLSEQGLRNPTVLRLRPDFGSCAVVSAGSESRFGFTEDMLQSCRSFLADCSLDVRGFHVFAGSQVLDADRLLNHLHRSLELSLRAADTVGIEPDIINLGGGFGIPYAGDDTALDIEAVANELDAIARRAPSRLLLELGRYFVAESGWYLTSVLGHQTSCNRAAVVVDGGVHQRADMCGLCLRTRQNAPLVIGRHGPTSGAPSDHPQPTDIWGSLSLPDDVLLESALLPPLSRGDVLAFGNAGAYGLWSSAAMFHGSPLPAEVAFDGTSIQRMRDRRSPESILDGQHAVEFRHTSLT